MSKVGKLIQKWCWYKLMILNTSQLSPEFYTNFETARYLENAKNLRQTIRGFVISKTPVKGIRNWARNELFAIIRLLGWSRYTE